MSELDSFLSLPTATRRARIISAILEEIRNIGGTATRHELRQGLREDGSAIPEDYFSYTRPSKSSKSGTYRPFDFDFYMSINDLLVTGFLEEKIKGRLQLSETGRKVDAEPFDPHDSVITAAAHIRAEKRRAKRRAATASRPVTGDAVSVNEDSLSSDPSLIPETSEEDVEEGWRTQLKAAIAAMDPQKFEIFCRALVRKMGVNVDKHLGVDYSHDGGIDGFGYIRSDAFETSRIAIQAKRWSNPVPAPIIDQFRGAIDKFHAEYGIFITSSTFTRGAREAAQQGSSVITLIDGDGIADLVSKFQLYVHPVTTYVLDDFFTEQD